MYKGVKLHKNKEMSIHKDVYVYNKPQYVYIPLISQNDTNITVLVKKGDYVYKGSQIGKRKGNFRIPILSSVSGTVVDFVTKTYLTGEQVKCVQIENDFKEKYEENANNRKENSKISKEEFIELIHDNGIVGLGGAGFPTYIKYSTDKKIKTLLVNAVECEPYITTDYMLMKEYTEEILEGMDMIMEINGIEQGVIAVKKSNTELIKLMNDYIGTYIKIKIVTVPNLYPMGWERTLIKEALKLEYDRIPIEQGIIVNNVATIYAMYEAIKNSHPLTERIVTFTGQMLKKPQNVLVKVGTEVREVIESIGGFKNQKDSLIIAGGPMMGVCIKEDDLVITPNLNCILILEDDYKYDSIECMRCGKCVSICPAKLSPVLIKDNLDNVDKLKYLEVNRCIECGLCSYICPSKIRIREFVRKAKENVKGSK